MAGVGESDSDAEAAVRMSFDGSEHSVPAAGEAAAQAAEAAQAELSLPPPAGVANPHTHAHAPQHYRHAPPLAGRGGGGPLAAVAAAAGRKRPGGRAAARAAEVGRWVRELLGGGAAPHLAEHGAVRTHTDPARRRPPWAGSRARPCTP
jgi:hypothetical protein